MSGKLEKLYDEKDPESIERYARRLVGHSLKEMTSEEGSTTYPSVTKKKGSFGELLERLYFKITPGNLDGVPDFSEASVELKSCPALYKGNGLKAKERLVLNLINYEKIAAEEWGSSAFWRKNRDLLLMFYLHEEGQSIIDLKVVLAGRWTFPEDDLIIIRRDWERIQAKVRAGKAHEISEGDTMYLGACTKDSFSRAIKVQPFSEVRAKQRALALKQSYVNSIIQRMKDRDSERELANKIIKDRKELEGRAFEDIVIGLFAPFIGKTTEEIASTLGIRYSENTKHYNALITRRILGVEKKALELERAEVTIRSVMLEADGRLVESISFPAFDPIILENEDDWETSSVREMFEKRFLFVVYQMRPDDKRMLKKVMFWTMPNKDLEEVRKVWEETVNRIRQRRYEDLPRMRDNPISHIRPHGRNAQDKVKAPDGSMVRKQCFWLSARYIAQQVNTERNVDFGQSKISSAESGSLSLGEVYDR